MSIRTSDLIKLAKHFNTSHRYKRRKAQVALHHFKEDMKIVEHKARAERAQHRQKRRENNGKSSEE